MLLRKLFASSKRVPVVIHCWEFEVVVYLKFPAIEFKWEAMGICTV